MKHLLICEGILVFLHWTLWIRLSRRRQGIRIYNDVNIILPTSGVLRKREFSFA